MKFLEPSDIKLIQDLDKNEKNKWRWQWLEEENDDGVAFRAWCRKIDAPGSCYCVVCIRTLVYSSSGKKALRSHSNDGEHKKALKSVQQSYSLPGDTSDLGIERKLSVTDRVQDVKARERCFIAEHCLPYSISSDLINLCKKLGEDPKALSATSMARTAATYTMTHGIAEHMKAELSDSLKDHFFSINVDEATNNAGDKVLNVLCQYFYEKQGKIVSELLGSRIVNLSTSENILNSVKDILVERGVDFSQIISATMDNCNAMRGAKSEFEQRLRAANPCLLDVSGDTVHMLSNAAKSFFDRVEKFCSIQTLISNIFYDVEDSPKVRSIFRDLQMKPFGKSWSIMRIIPTRFLQMLVVCDRISLLWDALLVFYHSFLSSSEKVKHHTKIDEIVNNCEDKKGVLKFLSEVVAPLKKQKSPAGSERMDKILLALFQQYDQTVVTLQLHRGILKQFNTYAKTFQSEKPQCHLLHTQMFQMMKDFYAQFIAPEHIDVMDANKLFKLETSDTKLQLSFVLENFVSLF